MDRLEDSSSPVQILWPTLEAMARPARERRRLVPAVRDGLIAQLCAKVPLSARELATLLDRTEAYTGDAIRPLVETGRLTFLFPNQPRHPKQRYLAVGSEAESIAAQLVADDPSDFAAVPADAKSRGNQLTAKEDLASGIWPELERIAAPGREHRRLAPDVRNALVVSLCARAPLSARELAALLGRSDAYVSDAIQPLVKTGKLGFLHPDQPRHPRQKYLALSLPAVDSAPALQATEPRKTPSQVGLADTGSADPEALFTLAQARWADLEQIARPARENRYLGGPEFAELLASVAAVAPASPRELAILTDRREEQIREVLDGMVSQGRLRVVQDTDSPSRLKYMAVSGSAPATDAGLPTAPQPDRPSPHPPSPRLLTAKPASYSPETPGEGSSAESPNITPAAETTPHPATEARLRTRFRPSFLNSRTNPVLAIATGIALGLTQPAWWLAWTSVAAVLLAGLHVFTDSVQFQRFRHLNHSRGRLLEFLVLKALVAAAEITALYYVTTTFRG